MSRYLAVSGLLVLVVVGLAWGFRRLVGGAWKARAVKRSLPSCFSHMLGERDLRKHQRICGAIAVIGKSPAPWYNASVSTASTGEATCPAVIFYGPRVSSPRLCRVDVVMVYAYQR